MTTIIIYDDDAKRLERIAEKLSEYPADAISELLDDWEHENGKA